MASTTHPTGERHSSRFDTAADILLGGLLIFLPFAFGGTKDLSHEILFVAATGLLGCSLLKFAADRAVPFRWSWTYLCIALFLLLVLFQLAELPVGMLSKLSPHTVSLRSMTLGDEPEASTLLARQTVSLYPLATIQNIQLVFAVACIFIAVIQLYQRPARIERLLLIVAVVGFAVSLVAVFQNLTGATTIYGIIPAVHRNSGPFMNYSHFGQFMNLSIGASLGLALMRWHQQVQRVKPRFVVLSNVTTFLQRPKTRLVVFLTAAAFVEAITVFLSLTRMGIISLLAAGALIGALVTRRSQSKDRGAFVILAGILLLGGLLIVGFDASYNRLATLRDAKKSDGGRLQMLKDLTVEFKQYPLFGTGLGTHEFVFPMYDRSGIPERATHAENEFAQMMEETGAVGLAIILAFVGILAANFFKAVRDPVRPVQYAAFGIGFGLIAILIHSCTDFGQHVPANAVLTACLSALLINIARLVPLPESPASPEPATVVPSPRFSRRLAIRRTSVALAGVGLLLLACDWSVRSANAARIASISWADADDAAQALSHHDWLGTDDDYINLLRSAQAAAALQPQSIVYRYWLNNYRWHEVCRTRNADGSFRLSNQDVGFVGQIVDELKAARPLCPTYGEALCLEGQLEHFVLRRPEGDAHVELGSILAPSDVNTCMVAGRLNAESGRFAEALTDFRRAVRYGGNKREAVAILVHTAHRPDLGYQFAAGDDSALRYLLDQISADPNQSVLAARCRNDLAAILEANTRQPVDSAETFATLAGRESRAGDAPAAISNYKRALALDYSQVDWHLQLADLLAKSGDSAGAMTEARICLRLRPQMKEAATLLGNLNAQAPTAKTATP
jgi:tetratricopeptide (TPR) repeat protein